MDTNHTNALLPYGSITLLHVYDFLKHTPYSTVDFPIVYQNIPESRFAVIVLGHYIQGFRGQQDEGLLFKY